MTSTDTPSAFSDLRDDLSRMPFKDMAKRAFKKFGDDDVPTLSAAFAYQWVFSIPPMLILIVLIAALINKVTSVPVVEDLRDLISDRAPADSREMLLRLVDKAVAQVGGSAASFGAVLTVGLALWAASSAVGILITGFNRAYDVVEERPFLRKKLLTLGLTLLLVLFINLAFALLVFGQQLGAWIADWVGLGSAFDTLWAIARWPTAILGIMLMLAVLYWAGPNVDQPFRWITVGSIVATLLWLIIVAGFGLYLSISNPGSAYGVVGSVIVLLFFLNITGLVFFLGSEINAILFRMVAEKPVPFVHGPAMAVANQ
jgi:membrane protein